ncbi:MAG: glucose 1-dehydrogenase [Lautropia sp.]|nr:glucose 1-dehydrogenase [Lautropia sp.]
MFDLTGKIALVTGASRGLGWAMAESLARAGAHVALNARDESALIARVSELGGRGLSAEACPFDVTDFDAAEHCVADLARRHDRFDILVANAGINLRAPITGFELADYQRVVETNQTAVWVLARAAARQMVPRQRGRIILTGSMSAINARANISAYVASKGAVHALTKQLAAELAKDGITANCIAPGFFATEMNTPLVENQAFNDWVCQRTPAGRWGRVEEIGPAAVFLASDEASFVSGLIMTVDGGFTSAM